MSEQYSKEKELELREKELELKMKELELREKELQLKMEKGERVSNVVSRCGSILLLLLKWAVIIVIPFYICGVAWESNVLGIGTHSLTNLVIWCVVGILLAIFLKKKLIG